MQLPKYYFVLSLVYLCAIDFIWTQNLKQEGVVYKYQRLTILNQTDENSLLDISDVKLSKINKTHYKIHGKVNVNLGERETDLMMTTHTLQKLRNGYVEIPLLSMENVNYCETIKNGKIKPFYEHFREHTNFPKECPNKVASYEIYDYIPDTSKYPIMKTGEYRLEVHMILDGIILVGYQVDFKIEQDIPLD